MLSKLVLLTVMLRGRHRILPMAIDRAVLLPGQELMERLDREISWSPEKRRDVEERIREDERGEQVEAGIAAAGLSQDTDEQAQDSSSS